MAVQAQRLQLVGLDYLRSWFPIFADQFGWGERLHQLGVSPKPHSTTTIDR